MGSQQPNALALSFQPAPADETSHLPAAQTLTFAELNAQANQIARYLREQGVATGDLVGLSFRRSSDMIIAMLAILKAGAAYVPLDPTYPEDRLAHMITDSGIANYCDTS